VIDVSASYGSNYPAATFSDGRAFWMELILTFGLVSVILGTASGAQSWALRPGVGGGVEVGGHDQRRASVERERRHQHPAVADGHQLGDAVLRLVGQQPTGSRDPDGWKSACASSGAFARAAFPDVALSSELGRSAPTSRRSDAAAASGAIAVRLVVSATMTHLQTGPYGSRHLPVNHHRPWRDRRSGTLEHQPPGADQWRGTVRWCEN
jgi:hypothetical protein